MPGPIITSPLSGRSVELGRPGQHENIGVFRSDLYASFGFKIDGAIEVLVERSFCHYSILRNLQEGRTVAS